MHSSSLTIDRMGSTNHPCEQMVFKRKVYLSSFWMITTLGNRSWQCEFNSNWMWIEGIELIRNGDAIIIKGAKGFVECNLHCILFSLKCIDIYEINKYFWILCSFTHEIIIFEFFQYVVKVLLHTQYTFWIEFS